MKDLKIYAHTPLFYWWPFILTAFGFGVWSLIAGTSVTVGNREATILASSLPGFIFITLTALTVFISTIRLKGFKSAALIISLAMVMLIVGLLGWIDDLANAIPLAATWMSAGFYFWIAGLVGTLWALQVFFFDRLVYYRVTPGQITRVKVIGGAERTYDARGMAIDHAADDFLRHILFGLGSGDITIRTSGADPVTLPISNVLFVRGKIKRLQVLSSVEPDSISDIET